MSIVVEKFITFSDINSRIMIVITAVTTVTIKKEINIKQNLK